MKLCSLTLLAPCLLAIASPASAQVNGFGEGEGFMAGVGIISDWSPYRGSESPSTTPIPYLAYDWENAHLGVDGFSYSFLNSENVEVAVLLEPRWSFGDPEDSPLFEDIERDTALEAGIEAQIGFGNFYVGGNILHDISDVHNGFEGAAEVGFETGFGPFEIDTKVGYAYRDKGLSLHLYGVRSDEARADLAAFTPNASLYPYVQSELIMPVSENMGVLAFARYEHLNKDATSSPLISKDRDATLGVAVLRRF